MKSPFIKICVLKLKSSIILLSFFFSSIVFVKSQSIENKEFIQSFISQLNENKTVSQILYLGDSHTQADLFTGFLRYQFQEKYGNAGRGLIFPYAVANSNGAEDFSAVSNQIWENFRLVHQQKVFSEIGASGFVIFNQKESFLEFNFKNKEDSFDKLVIFGNDKNKGNKYQIYQENKSLNDFVKRESQKITYQIKNVETLPEIASEFYTTTTKLKSLNGNKNENFAQGKNITVEKVNISYNPEFENNIKLTKEGVFAGNSTEINFEYLQSNFLFKTQDKTNNYFYGFQFLKNIQRGVVFNSVGVNGATFADFLKFPLQLQQLKSTKPNLVIIALGTNESMTDITKEDFQKNISALISELRKENPSLPILLISPTDNLQKPQKIKEIVSWVKESAEINKVSFFNLYKATGEKGYFKKALSKKEANSDGIHFLKSGYEKQAQLLWKAFSEVLN